ncbi:MAG: SusD/RagB family nutrient-binding outer membrane lipoprotein [Ginsengibacter sp.]
MRDRLLSPFRMLSSLSLLLVFVGIGCTKNYSERNTDPTRITDLSTGDIKGLFTNAEYMAMYAGDNSAEYQYAQGFVGDVYSQFTAITATFDPTDRYNIEQSWMQEQWIATYIKSLPPLVAILNATNSEPDDKALYSIARVWKAFIMHRATDLYGPVPYSQIGADSTVVLYDSQESIYMDLFKELHEAVADLKANISLPSFGSQDLIYNGDNNEWVKFANTLRLRLALRISGVEPAMAQQEAEAAVADGVMTDLSDDAYLPSSTVNYNGYCRQSGWNEFRMSSAMESVLVGYNDPRLPKIWQPALNTGTYEGVRNGMNVAEISLDENGPDNNSQNTDYLLPESQSTTPNTVMRTAEAYFLRAEGALNGWNMGGTAEEFYKKGIEMSFRTWGINNAGVIDNYINSMAVPIAPGGYFNTPALTDIPVKFSSDPAKQREQIQQQKWIALFPDGEEAWSSMRATGFPKRYPLIHSDNPAVPADSMIRRIPFLDYDRDRNGAAVEAAASLLRGPDNAGTRLWWDVRP